MRGRLPSELRDGTMCWLLGGALALGLVSLASPALDPILPDLAPAAGWLVYLLAAMWVMRNLHRHTHARFGAGNAVSLLRLVVLCLLAMLCAASRHGGWLALTLAIVFLLLDGLDGYAARRDGTCSAFGARFDIELDALFVLLACGWLWWAGKAQAWVLLGGVPHYLFLFGRHWRPSWRRPLAPSRRRGTIGMVQASVLTGCLAPITGPPLTTLALGLALLLVALSFWLDLRPLARRGLRSSAAGEPPAAARGL